MSRAGAYSSVGLMRMLCQVPLEPEDVRRERQRVEALLLRRAAAPLGQPGQQAPEGSSLLPPKAASEGGLVKQPVAEEPSSSEYSRQGGPSSALWLATSRTEGVAVREH